MAANVPMISRGAALLIPLPLAAAMVRTFGDHALNCAAKTADGRPIILAHDVHDARRLLAGLASDIIEHVAVHAGDYVDHDDQILRPPKDQYMLLAASGGRVRHLPCHLPAAGMDRDSPTHDYLLVGFRQVAHSDAGHPRQHDVSGRHEIIDIDDPRDPLAGGNFADLRARADRLLYTGDYWAVAVRRRDDPCRRWAYFATASGAAATTREPIHAG